MLWKTFRTIMNNIKCDFYLMLLLLLLFLLLLLLLLTLSLRHRQTLVVAYVGDREKNPKLQCFGLKNTMFLYVLAHLNLTFNWAFLVTCCTSSVRLSVFAFLIFNFFPRTNFNQTLHKITHYLNGNSVCSDKKHAFFQGDMITK